MNPEKTNQKWKTLSLEELIITTPTFIPFVILTETHLKPDVLDAEMHIQNYSLYRADRINREKGGAIIYVHESIVITSNDIYSDKYCQAVLIYSEIYNITLIGAYRPPDTPCASFSNMLSKAQEFIDKHKSADIYLLGDLNFPQIQWKTTSIKSGKSTEENISARLLLDFMDQHFMIQHVEENTRADKNILDVIIMNNDEYLHSIRVEKCKITSDHDIVVCDLINLFKNTSSINEPYTPSNQFDKWNWNKADWVKIREELGNHNWNQLLNCESVTDMCNIFEETVIEISSKFTKHQDTPRSRQSKIPSDRMALIKNKKRVNSKINRIKYLGQPRKSPEQTKSSLDNLYKQKVIIEEAMKQSIKTEQSREEEKILNKIKTNPKVFYAYAKRKSSIKCKIGPLKDSCGKLHTDAQKMANILQQQYKRVFSDPDENTDFNTSESNEYSGIESMHLTEEDFTKAIDLIPSNSASGPDKFPIRILKECKQELSKPLCIIWRQSLETGEIPHKYLEQTIVPIFKKGNKADPANYRPVSLTSHIIKNI